jgi:signal transduction histidine kinase/FixJ family two-component response regulator
MDQSATQVPASAATVGGDRLFAGGGEMAALMRATDWSRTPLGSVDMWSPALRMMVRLLLSNRFPLLLWWGPGFHQLYNDPYRPVLGTKHPRSLGQPASECFPEIWDVIGPLIEAPFTGGAATWSEDLFLEVLRHGFVEETHFTVAYSPVPDDTAPHGIGGVLATVHETTEQVIGERRMVVLRDLGARSAEAKTAEEACQIAAETMALHPKDVPFALIYLLDRDGKQARLAASAGVEAGAHISPHVVALGGAPAIHAAGEQAWPLATAVRTNASVVVEDLSALFSAVPRGPWADAPHSAVVVPVRSNIAHQPAGLLVIGVSPRLRFDDTYAGFLELASSQIGTAIANARAYEEERRRAEALAEIDRAKTVFFNNVSHEFRTPLTLILSPLDDLLARPHDLSPAVRAELDSVYRNALRLLKLVNTLLDFSRIEAGRTRAIYAPTDLAALTSDLASVFRSVAERAGLRLVVDCPPLPEDAPPAYVDRDMWEKIVLNLVSNAFKFTFEGSITVTLRHLPSPRGRGAGGEVVLTVSDTGTGISSAEVPRLFDRFHRVEGARSRSYEGSGIGLALVRELVHMHGGTIHAESAEGRGTTFTVRLPLGAAHLPTDRVAAEPALAATALGTAPFLAEARGWLPDPDGQGVGGQEPDPALDWLRAEASAPAAARSARILVADDNADMRAYLRRLLGERYAVEVVADGARALAAALDRPPDIVLSDVMMPSLDGYGLLRALRADARTAAIPVILISARAGEEATVEGLSAGADDYLVKPFSAREVLSRVAARLELTRMRREVLHRAREMSPVFEAMADGVVIYDDAGSLVQWNAAVADLFEFDRMPDYVGQPVRTRPSRLRVRDADGEPIPAERLPFMRAVRGETLTGAHAVDLTFTVPSGRDKYVSASAAPLRDAAGRVVGAVTVYRDVTERRHLEQRMHDSLAALLGMAGVLVAAPADDAGQLETERAEPEAAESVLTEAVRRVLALIQRAFAGQYTAALLVDIAADAVQPLAVVGLTPEIEARWWADLRQHPPVSAYLPAPLMERLRAEDVIEMDLSGQLPVPGQDHWGIQRVLAAAQRLPQGQLCVIGVEVRDRAVFTPPERELAQAAVRLVALVVERERLRRERAEGQLRELTLQMANARMDEFLGIASHELRTPLTALKANLQILERRLVATELDRTTANGVTAAPDGSAGVADAELPRLLVAARRALVAAERSGERLERLVGDLVDVSRIQAGKLELRPAPCDLLAIVREAVEEQRAAWPGRALSLDLPRRAPLRIDADADRIGQVVTNYLTNALKYSTADAPVEVRVRVRGGVAHVTVRDHGPGLTAAGRARLFERFYRVPGVTLQSGSGVGLGLGLHICKTIVERHGGEVGVTSKPGAGSTFWFTLPLAADAEGVTPPR